MTSTASDSATSRRERLRARRAREAVTPESTARVVAVWRRSRCGGRCGRGDGDWRCRGGRRRVSPCHEGRVVSTWRACSQRSGLWIVEQRLRQVPRLLLDPSGVSESEARTGARELVSALAEEEAERIGVEYRRIRIGGQRTLWGSCSPGGTLSFNWRLVLAPPEVLDYVVVHELCHLRVPNHSRRFWALVERHRAHCASAARLAAQSRA